MADELRIFFAKKVDGCVECPVCGAGETIKSGKGARRQQQYKCLMCGRRFVDDPGVPQVVKILVDRMLDENISAAVISRVIQGGASKRWVYNRKSQRS